MMKYLQKFASSKYFQQATEYKYIKRAMENVSNTPLQLRVTVKHLSGKLAINIPPPPSDRLWYGAFLLHLCLFIELSVVMLINLLPGDRVNTSG